jgi:hypothetical protein
MNIPHKYMKHYPIFILEKKGYIFNMEQKI